MTDQEMNRRWLPDKHRDTKLVWQALALVTQAANKDAVRITVDPKDLKDMEAMLDRMSDLESTCPLESARTRAGSGRRCA